MSEKQFKEHLASLTKEERLKYIQAHISNIDNGIRRFNRELEKIQRMLLELY
jgi:glutathione synthase/RimK-type ligase-like ATP-grasp enzyme